MAEHHADAGHDDDLVIDLDRAALPGPPPVAGAQWDEFHRRWEHWDDVAEAWMIVGDDSGQAVVAPTHWPVPASLARQLRNGHEADTEDEAEDDEPHIIDIDRLAAPADTVPGAQWNEVVGRWERWDDAAGAWVQAVAAR